MTNAEKQAAQRKARSDELKRLRAFVQWVADHSNDPAVVREAKAHGAK
jgi:stringent starvation protein B